MLQVYAWSDLDVPACLKNPDTSKLTSLLASIHLRWTKCAQATKLKNTGDHVDANASLRHAITTKTLIEIIVSVAASLNLQR